MEYVTQCPEHKRQNSKGLEKAHERNPNMNAHNRGSGKMTGWDKFTNEEKERMMETGQQNGIIGHPEKRKMRRHECIDSFGNSCTLESMWEVKLAKSFDKNGVKWIRPPAYYITRRRRYEPDFYLVDYGVYIDPKSPIWETEYQLGKIAIFEKKCNTKVIIIHDRKNLNWEYVQEQIKECNQ